MMDFLRKGKRGYIIIMICVLFLGMCRENMQADSALMYGIIHHAESVLKNREQAELSDSFYAESMADMLYTGTVFRQESRQVNSKGVRETFSPFFVIDFFFRMIPAFFVAACAGFYNGAVSSNRIVCYIHLKDGKKSDSVHTVLMTGRSRRKISALWATDIWKGMVFYGGKYFSCRIDSRCNRRCCFCMVV